MADIIDTLHPKNSLSDNLYPNIKADNIPSKSINYDKLNNDVTSKIEELETKFKDVNQLRPSGTDTSSNILAFTENKGIYIGTDTGNWYYWNGSAYADGGVYQSGVNYDDLKNDIKNTCGKLNNNLFPSDASSGWQGTYSDGVWTSSALSGDNSTQITIPSLSINTTDYYYLTFSIRLVSGTCNYLKHIAFYKSSAVSTTSKLPISTTKRKYTLKIKFSSTNISTLVAVTPASTSSAIIEISDIQLLNYGDTLSDDIDYLTEDVINTIGTLNSTLASVDNISAGYNMYRFGLNSWQTAKLSSGDNAQIDISNLNLNMNLKYKIKLSMKLLSGTCDKVTISFYKTSVASSVISAIPESTSITINENITFTKSDPSHLLLITDSSSSDAVFEISDFELVLDYNQSLENYYDYINFSMFEKFGVIGDSFASGELVPDGTWVGAKDVYSISWGQILARKNGNTCVNFSKGGLTSGTWITDSYGLEKLNSEDAQDLYIIALGINDGTAYDNNMGSESDIGKYDDGIRTWYACYSKIVESISSKSSTAKIICINVRNGIYNASTINTAIQNIADHYGIMFIDQNDDNYISSVLYSSQWINGHPRAVGYSCMATAFEKLINKCIAYNYDYFKDYKL